MGTVARFSTRQALASVQDGGAILGRQYLTFLLAGETFGIPISAIKEIIEHRPATDMPMMPAFVRGVINLRGRAVPVIDLSARFGRGAGQTTRRTCILIVEMRHEGQQHDVGVSVDAVSAVLDIADADVEPLPTFATRVRADFISGMGKVGGRFVIMLDIDKVLSADELSLLGEVSDAGQPLDQTATIAAAAAPSHP